jgi:class 3 adenylate cyclase/predicted ATPase
MGDGVDIAAWLRELELERYEQAFRDSDIGGDILADLTETDLEELGVAQGHRKKLLDAIAALSAQECSGMVGSTASHREVRPAEALVKSPVEQRQLTVLFCDLTGSTELPARPDPADFGRIIHAYHRCCREVLRRWDGHVAKSSGDGVLVYFGYPRAHEGDAERAVRAGLDLVEAVGRLTAEHAPLAARVGIATGLVMVGDLIGQGAASEEAVVGETPQLAARLQTLAGPGTVIVAQGTRDLLGGLFEYQDLGMQRLNGFAEPVRCWRVTAESAAEGRFEALRGARLPPLVGREEEINLLQRGWKQARDGEGQVVLLSGEPGIGKSRIALGLLEGLTSEPLIRLRYQCSQFHSRSAFHPVLQQMARAAGIEDTDPAELKLAKLEAVLRLGTGQVEEAVLLLAPLLSIPIAGRGPPPQLSAERRRQRTCEIMLEQLEGLAAKQPLLMIFEDAQWVDPSTSELVGLAIERIQKLPALLLVTFRSDFVPPWHGRHVTALSLARLNRRQILTMVDWLTDGKALPAEILEQIVDRTDGVPLFVEELTKTVLESGLLVAAADRYELAGPLPPLAVPATLRDSLMARLDRLGAVRQVAQIGAVIGREFSHALLAAVADRPEPELQAALDQLVASELVFRRGLPPEASYSFKHALVQEAAYGTLPKSRRQQLHARIAKVLEEQFPTTEEARPELLANHCTEAGLIETAIQYWQRAGQQAIARSAMAEAIAQLTKGITLLAGLPDGADRRRQELGLQLALGGALSAGRGTGVAETGRAYARAAELCEQTGERSLLAAALHGLIVFHFSRAELAPALALAERALATAERDGEIAARVAGHFSVGWVTLALGRLSVARGHLERALELHEIAREAFSRLTDIGVKCLAYLSWALLILGQPDRARVRSRDALLEAERAHPFTLGFALHRALTVLQVYRDVPAVAENVTAMLALGREQGFPIYVTAGTFYRGWLLVQGGSASEGVALMREELARLRANGDEDFLPYSLLLLAEAHRELGQTAMALDLVDEALARVERTGERLFEAELHRLKGGLMLLDPGADQAEACLRRAIEIARAQGAKLWELRAATSLARLWAEQGRQADAHDLLAPVYGWFTEGFDTPDLKDAKALLDELG